MKRVAAVLGLLALVGTAPVDAQSKALGAAVLFQGYTFDDGLGIKAANLLLFPVAYDMPLGRSIDLYSAYARGSAEVEDAVYTMTGFVDTRVRLNWNVQPWAMITFGLNLPTGNSNHTSEEAIVANVLATEVLGFREAAWGLGFGATTGLATAYRIGGLGIGMGASYRVASEFEPRADTSLKYTPGNETRLRLALEQGIGSSKLTAGVTYQNYTKDELDGQDLFQPGSRLRGDVAFSFRTGGAATWTMYAADVWREHGDVRFSESDSTISTGKQNMLIAGIAGALRFSPGFSLRPSADIRRLSREEEGGEGWIAGIGTDIPLRMGSMDLFPTVKFLFGKLEGASDTSFRATGGEIGLTVRFGGG
jgi:hypothetical protein